MKKSRLQLKFKPQLHRISSLLYLTCSGKSIRTVKNDFKYILPHKYVLWKPRLKLSQQAATSYLHAYIFITVCCTALSTLALIKEVWMKSLLPGRGVAWCIVGHHNSVWLWLGSPLSAWLSGGGGRPGSVGNRLNWELHWFQLWRWLLEQKAQDNRY